MAQLVFIEFQLSSWVLHFYLIRAISASKPLGSELVIFVFNFFRVETHLFSYIQFNNFFSFRDVTNFWVLKCHNFDLHKYSNHSGSWQCAEFLLLCQDLYMYHDSIVKVTSKRPVTFSFNARCRSLLNVFNLMWQNQKSHQGHPVAQQLPWFDID